MRNRTPSNVRNVKMMLDAAHPGLARWGATTLVGCGSRTVCSGYYNLYSDAWGTGFDSTGAGSQARVQSQ